MLWKGALYRNVKERYTMFGSTRLWKVRKAFVSFLLANSQSVSCNVQSTRQCRSNSTHIAWPSSESELQLLDDESTGPTPCIWQERHEAERDALAYLRENVMEFDKPMMQTMGFMEDGQDGDGLDNGLVGPTVSLALDAKIKYPWADKIPKSIYYEYVLNYANTNEARSNWRPLITNALEPILSALPSDSTVNDVVIAVNSNLFKVLSRDGNDIFFKAEQTPLIFDPMSVIVFGYASCTGLAILFVNGLRAAGIPARMAGTPAWQNDPQKGNHNWVEVYRDGKWDFLEPGGDDDLDKDPCGRWFCNPSSNWGLTRVYAARLDKKQSDTCYPLSWERDNTDVPGEDRTQYYIDHCSCNEDRIEVKES